MIEQIIYQDQLLAVIISHKFDKPGIHFFTPNELSQQLAYMRHSKGKVIQPHVHNAVPREVLYTQEVLFIKRGKLRVDFYNDQQKYLESRMLEGGDVILLVTGGHGFEVLEEIEMIELPFNDASSAPLNVAPATVKAHRRMELVQLAALYWSFFLEGWNDGSNGPLLPAIQRHYHVRARLNCMPTSISN